MRSTRQIPLLVMLFAVGACTAQPLLDPVDATLPPGHSAEEVREAIFTVGSLRGWSMREAGEGVIKASLALRVHRANVEIRYSPTDLHIRYLDSTNLDYKDGKIHRNYNRWVNNLRADIQNLLAAKKV